MGASTGPEESVRLLGLGNEILADDAFGIRVAERVRQEFGDLLDVVASTDTGFNLIDNLVGVSRLLVVDTMVTGRAKPGAIRWFEAEQASLAPGDSPHAIGLFEVLALARALGLAAPRRTTVIAVEAADCSTVGGAMHPDVEAAIGEVTNWVRRSGLL